MKSIMKISKHSSGDHKHDPKLNDNVALCMLDVEVLFADIFTIKLNKQNTFKWNWTTKISNKYFYIVVLILLSK